MGFRLKTSKETKEIFEKLDNSINLKPFALCKVAMSLSLKNPSDVKDYSNDINGLELNRQTITAEHDIMFKVLMENHAKKHLSDDDYFPKYTKWHIDRGAKMLESKIKYYGNLEQFIKNMISGDDKDYDLSR
ncbi:DndE family protein [Anaeromicrobium sediminis]|uniref:DNA sulfur modification protein DndE n=1 Tax=Anaeromicrobium sediminis TaxID=1478221 RepID=A0A267MNT3_9FIRM|nr:DndE family protein [Anaeromicrobium sediminis]PAB60535.1 DNA sulfur modification protein DndE [Anaeromicrobium sediminis]